MAEYKQYITQVQENGNVMISENVVAAIVAHTLAEIDGIGSLGTKPGITVQDFDTEALEQEPEGPHRRGQQRYHRLQPDDQVWLQCCRRI